MLKKIIKSVGKMSFFFLKDYKNKDGVLQRYMVRRRKREGCSEFVDTQSACDPPSNLQTKHCVPTSTVFHSCNTGQSDQR